ncbi:MAG: hypothetical protein LJF30_23775 [Acidobacteria bacterium]|nr:hypothetical protein [Acidobacteriota bacterium]
MKLTTTLLLSSSILLVNCSVEKVEKAQKSENAQVEARPFVVLCFDVEDYTSPESVGMDDIPKWLAETMTERGATGSFFVIGEKARALEARGRRDVIEAMARHDVGSHTSLGSIHPTVTEILEHASFEAGVETMLENEGAGFDDLERIFGQRPAALARHGGSYGPQLVAALSRMGAAYVYSPVSLPGHNAVWFAGALNFHGEGDFGFFDDAYHDDALFEPMLAALDEKIPAGTRGLDVVAFFANHPSKVRSIEFWDFNYYKGANPGPEDWKTPELRPLETMETARKNFGRLVEYLQGRDDIELTTYRDMVERFGYQAETIGTARLAEIAQKVLEEGEVVIAPDYSPAETFAALAAALAAYGTDGQVPEEMECRRPFGPLQRPPREPGVAEVTGDQALALAQQAHDVVTNENHLPFAVQVDGAEVGTGSLLALFSAVYADVLEGRLAETYAVPPFAPHPTENEDAIVEEVRGCKDWPVHREDLDMSDLVEMTRLQMWTLKPARAR